MPEAARQRSPPGVPSDRAQFCRTRSGQNLTSCGLDYGCDRGYGYGSAADQNLSASAAYSLGLGCDCAPDFCFASVTFELWDCGCALGFGSDSG